MLIVVLHIVLSTILVREAAVPVKAQWNAAKFSLILNPGQSDYASCSGTYRKMSVGTIRGSSIYLNSPKSRFMFYDGGRWVITSTGYFTVVLNGATGGFYGSRASKSEPSETSWAPRYRVG